SINMSPGGYVRRFYQLKEAWYLSHITRRELRPQPIDTFNDEEARARIRDFDAAFYRKHASAEWYAKVRHKRASVILEFDLDSIADTYECQSPVFVDGNWILDRERLAGQIEPISTMVLPQLVRAPAALSAAATFSTPTPPPAPDRADVVLLKM